MFYVLIIRKTKNVKDSDKISLYDQSPEPYVWCLSKSRWSQC